MRDNVTNMPYLRNMSKAQSALRERAQRAFNNYQRLKEQRDALAKKGAEYIERAETSENEALMSQGKIMIVKANDINGKMTIFYQQYLSLERELEKMK